jgi:hypothetical protein
VFVKAYACVYRHSTPSARDRRLTAEAARSSPLLQKYLDRYDAPDCFDDWGDDPSFFAATEMLGSPNRATWGVCRRDVRTAMSPGSFVVFFCGREDEPGRWHYFYVGVGSVGQLLDRYALWSDDTFERYRHFFNVLARPVGGILQQHETIHRYHPDWEARALAPYIVFDPRGTSFNLKTPLHVASYDRRANAIEVWREEDERVREIGELILPSPPTRRGLRSTNVQRAHPKMNLAKQAERAGGFGVLRAQLLNLAAE